MGYQVAVVKSKTVSAKNMGNHARSSVKGRNGVVLSPSLSGTSPLCVALLIDGSRQTRYEPPEVEIFVESILHGRIGTEPAAEHSTDQKRRDQNGKDMKYAPEEELRLCPLDPGECGNPRVEFKDQGLDDYTGILYPDPLPPARFFIGSPGYEQEVRYQRDDQDDSQIESAVAGWILFEEEIMRQDRYDGRNEPHAGRKFRPYLEIPYMEQVE